ncbi:MAG: LuxR family transcriptional regulator [Rhodocyclaceae bacterium]|nr:LuxR family transcriptional regulator [Rhodocyclaceae bacterium]
MPPVSLHEWFEALQSARSSNELRVIAARLSNQLGFEHFAYALKIAVPLTQQNHHVFSGFPEGWQRRYVESDYFTIDPVLHETANGLLPVIWQDRHFKGERCGEFWEDARSHGVCHGLSLPVREKPGLSGVFSLARDRALEHQGPELAALLGNVQMFAILLHEAVCRVELQGRLPDASVQLTARERECLQWTGDGKTAWEIGQILQISERTAVFHLNNCVSKLGAANRIQAVVRAMSLGLL